MIQFTLTLKMTTTKVGEMSVTIDNSPIQDSVFTDDHAHSTFYSSIQRN